MPGQEQLWRELEVGCKQGDVHIKAIRNLASSSIAKIAAKFSLPGQFEQLWRELEVGCKQGMYTSRRAPSTNLCV